jgi:ribose transport system ATP-binding protein
MAIENLSGGNQQKVLISRWLVRDTELLLLDEPTAGVDLVARAEIHKLLRELTAQGKTVIVASVEADELTTLCDRVLVMVEGEIRAQLDPPFSEQELVNALFRHRGGDADSAR